MVSSLEHPVILGYARTAIGKYGGSLAPLKAADLGGAVVKEALRRSGVRPDQLSEVILGNVLQSGQGQNPARQAAAKAGVPWEVDSFTVNKVCGSGMKAVMLASQAILSGEVGVWVAGGMESMSNVPYYLYQARFGYRMGDGKVVDGMVYDGLWDIYNDYHMGMTGEWIADKFGLTRGTIDEFAVRSHRLAAAARDSGTFAKEIVPVEVRDRKGVVTVDRDEGIRDDSSVESLAKLRPVFKPDGVITAGNASQISDGAAALVVAHPDAAKESGLRPIARILGFSHAGLPPEQIMYAPVPATRKLLDQLGMGLGEFDLIEHNEAFASASVAVMNELGIPEDRFNVYGGAVALGHPIGCSGARILCTLLTGLRERGGKRGLATLCIGGGMATAMAVEML